ncbi:MAG: hypothetical protein ACUVUQ_06850, partial [Thermodesulfovibrionales bacterium]
HLILAGEERFFDSSPLKSFFRNVSNISSAISPPNKNVIFAIFTDISAGKGTSGIDERERNKIYSLIKKAKNSIVISFGSPYILRFFRDADGLIAAYEPTEQAQNAVIKCLRGEKAFKGRLPVKI